MPDSAGRIRGFGRCPAGRDRPSRLKGCPVLARVLVFLGNFLDNDLSARGSSRDFRPLGILAALRVEIHKLRAENSALCTRLSVVLGEEGLPARPQPSYDEPPPSATCHRRGSRAPPAPSRELLQITNSTATRELPVAHPSQERRSDSSVTLIQQDHSAENRGAAYTDTSVTWVTPPLGGVGAFHQGLQGRFRRGARCLPVPHVLRSACL